VLCLSAGGDGNARIEARIASSSSPIAPAGYGVLLLVEDNGEATGEPVDRAAAFLTPPPSARPDCPLVALPLAPIGSGDFAVHDGA
jgi:hypothetical protein